eukprot:COSAG04_NODE_2054_length_4901_cov_1.544565_4_plen_145_part_00
MVPTSLSLPSELAPPPLWYSGRRGCPPGWCSPTEGKATRSAGLTNDPELAEAGKTEDGETLQLRVDILEAEQDEAKLVAFDRLVHKKDEEKGEALARQAAENDTTLAEKDAEIAQKDAALEQKDAALAEQKAEIVALRAQLAQD